MIKNEAIHFHNSSKKYFAEAGFNLRKLASNDWEIHAAINDSSVKTGVKDLLGTSNKYLKVLGINWNPTNDKFVYELSKIGVNGLSLDVTKRNLKLVRRITIR